MSEPDPKQRQFDVLFSTLCEFQNGMLTSTTQVAGFLSVTIGWLATSSDARHFLAASRDARRFAILALLSTFLLYAFASVKVFRSSKKTFGLLCKLDFMPSEYYQNRVIDLPILLVFVVGNFFLVALVIGFVWRAI
jgi:hypothetical protein